MMRHPPCFEPASTANVLKACIGRCLARARATSNVACTMHCYFLQTPAQPCSSNVKHLHPSSPLRFVNLAAGWGHLAGYRNAVHHLVANRQAAHCALPQGDLALYLLRSGERRMASIV